MLFRCSCALKRVLTSAARAGSTIAHKHSVQLKILGWMLGQTEEFAAQSR
jgi:hypothetical protein